MTDGPARWRRVEELFHAAVELDPDARARLLAERRAEAPEVAAEVEELLAAHGSADAFLARPASTLDLALPGDWGPGDRGPGDRAPRDRRPGERGHGDRRSGGPSPGAWEPGDEGPGGERTVGGWRIVRRLGEGGMGVVYEAARGDPPRRAALKLLRGGPFADERAERRFLFEAESLRRLDHPGIARVLEVGRTADAVPFLAMELVDGEPLDAWLARRPSRARVLRVALALCDAVAHAHARGLVHRDLKPANLYVVDAEAEPPDVRVLDFGLARSDEGDAPTTLSGQVVGTPATMSPEQASGRRAAVGPWSDVWSLGVVLFEALTGELPVALGGLRVHEAVRALAAPTPRSAARLDRSLRGELDAILAAALEPEPARRYPDAGALADDLRRHLAGVPVRAPRRTPLRRLAAAARANRAAAAVAAAALLVLAGVATSTSVLYARARRAEAGARAEAAVAGEAVRFLEDTFAAVDPAVARGREPTVRELLAEAAERASARAFAEPAVEASVHGILGRARARLGELDAAQAHLARALEAALPAERPRLRTDLGELLLQRGEWPAALDALERAAAALAPDALPLDRARTEGLRAHALRLVGRLEEARAAYDLADAALDAAGPRVDPLERARLLHGRAGLAAAGGAWDEAEALYAEALALREARGGPDHPTVIETRNALGVLHQRRGDPAAAEPHLAAALEGMRLLVGDDHPDVATLRNNHGAVLRELGRLDEAEEALRVAVERRRALYGERHALVAIARNNLALLHLARGALDEAEAEARAAAAASRESLGAAHPQAASHAANLATVLLEAGRPAEAAELLAGAAAALEAAYGPDHPRAERVRASLALAAGAAVEGAAVEGTASEDAGAEGAGAEEPAAGAGS